MANPQKKYTAKIKLKAIKLVLDDGLPRKEVTKEIGCGESTLKAWIKQYNDEQNEMKPEPTTIPPEEIEVNKLDSNRKEVLKTYNFTLVLSGVNIHTPNLEDSLFEAGCSDSLLSSDEKAVYIEFTRKSSSYEDAVISAINNIENCSLDAKVIYVDHKGYADSIHLLNIAALLNVTNHIAQHYEGDEKGKECYLTPRERIHEHHQIGMSNDINPTSPTQSKIENGLEDEVFITQAFNEVLKIKTSKPEVKRILGKLLWSTF